MSETLLAVETWPEANQRHLVAALARVRLALERHAGASSNGSAADEAPLPEVTPTAALDRLCVVFGLSPFERDVLLLCAGVELDASFASLCGAAPTFGFSLAVLPGSHWSALTPAAPLRYWHLVEVGPGAALTTSPLRIDERVLHYLTGVDYVDERLSGIVEMPRPLEAPLCESQRARAARIENLWRSVEMAPELPPVQLIGADATAQRDVALAACGALNLRLHHVRPESLPSPGSDLGTCLRLWEREAALTGCAMFLDCDELDEVDAQRLAAVRRVVASLRASLIVGARQPLASTPRPLVTIEVERPSRAEQTALWRAQLGGRDRRGGRGRGRLAIQPQRAVDRLRRARGACLAGRAVGDAVGRLPDADPAAARRPGAAHRAASRPGTTSCCRRRSSRLLREIGAARPPARHRLRALGLRRT